MLSLNRNETQNSKQPANNFIIKIFSAFVVFRMAKFMYVSAITAGNSIYFTSYFNIVSAAAKIENANFNKNYP
jgi:hypothetical protein